ncbi:RecQ family ATP-dependent DNA helicase [Naasia sp. SYSU D00057]|uniref:RecQ family ATP-dependent DNA helicase n=1 Tax=Naasia sp. SYSU D00057 TaxID=2817380 RepID=UPI001B30CAC1|nr:RecQ family ATP-dependent DNA helicase [Naasia sp. SYSU D00057]
MASADSTRIRTTAELFGWSELRPGIGEAVQSLLDGSDVLAVFPTGYGKSAVYKVAGALLPGPTVVVSPLIALQTDQVAGIEAEADAPDAVAINSAQSDSANESAWEELAAGRAEYVFLSPEQLANEEVVDRLAKLGPGLFVVDEAHCVSAWGHDFRPDYLRLGAAAEAVGRPLILALTATGSAPVREEIVDRLGMRDPVVLTRGYDRPNIRLEVVRHSEERGQRAAVLEQLTALPKPGLLYVATRRATEEYAEELSAAELRAAAYHGGLGAKARRELHEAFRDDEYDVVVATSAFGMGIDKPNVRFVVHAAIPGSVDDYYQELGRAGRDGEEARATLHYRAEDLGLRRFFAGGKPDRAKLGAVHAALVAAGRTVELKALAKETGLTARRVADVVNLLTEAGAVRAIGDGVRAVRGVTTEEAVERSVEQAAQRERIDESRVAMVRQYAETTACRRQFLLGYFGERLEEPCGNCDTCTSGTAYEQQELTGVEDADDVPYPVEAAVRHREWGDGTVMSVEEDRITVFFESEGYRVLSLAAVADHDLLERVS